MPDAGGDRPAAEGEPQPPAGDKEQPRRDGRDGDEGESVQDVY